MPTLEMPPLTTQNQVDVLAAIERSHLYGQAVPSYKDLAAIVPGLNSHTSVMSVIESLRKKGYLGEGGGRARTFELKIPILAPVYIGAIDLYDGSVSLGTPKKIPHTKPWEGCVGLELLRDDEDNCRVAGDVLILKPALGYRGQSLGRMSLQQWEMMEFDQSPGKAVFGLVGVWREID